MEIAAEVASQQTGHSWLAPILLRLDSEEKEMEAEYLLSKWIEKEAHRIAPQSSLAGRIVRETAGLLLESAAVSKYLESHPEWEMYMPVMESAQEAAMTGSLEVMAEAADEAAATRVLVLMERGQLRPDVLLTAQLMAL